MKKVLITIIALITTATFAYAGMRQEKKMSVQEILEHPALDVLATGYSNSNMIVIF